MEDRKLLRISKQLNDETINTAHGQRNRKYTYSLRCNQFKTKQIFSSGTIQENFLLTADEGKYVLKYYKTRTKEYVKF